MELSCNDDKWRADFIVLIQSDDTYKNKARNGSLHKE